MFKFSQVNIAWIISLTKRFLPYSNTVQVFDFTKTEKQKQNPKRWSCWITVLSKEVITFIHRRQKENLQLNFNCGKFPKVYKCRKKFNKLLCTHHPASITNIPKLFIHPFLPQGYLEANPTYLTISSVTVRIRQKKYIIPNRTLNDWQEISTTFD